VRKKGKPVRKKRKEGVRTEREGAVWGAVFCGDENRYRRAKVRIFLKKM
jgi:hypothetical protein